MTNLDVERVAVEERRRRRIRIARMEADLAYFQARLELIGEPISSNQRAQKKLFELLHREIGTRLSAVKEDLAALSASGA
jgi:hypothetical protein